MGKITEENMYENLEFTCARCSRKCSKTSAVEPEIGYISIADNKYVGPICSECIDEMKHAELVIKKPLETVFIVGIQSDGHGVIIKQDGIDLDYLRDATTFDIKAACNEVIENINSVQQVNKIAGLLRQVAKPVQNPFAIPKKR